jgi:hypothetical protein
VGAILAKLPDRYGKIGQVIEEKSYEHSVVKKPNIITEPAARRIEPNMERMKYERDEGDS